MTTIASPVPRHPWRLWRSPYLWLATVHLLGDSIVVLTSGLVALGAVCVALLGWPLAFLGVPLSRGASRAVYALAGWERARARITRGQEVLPVKPPERSGNRVLDARRTVADPNLWRQFLYYVLLLPAAAFWLLLIVIAWSIPPVLITLPLYFSRFAAERAQLGPFVVDTEAKAVVAAVLGALFLVFVSPVLMRTASAMDGHLARIYLGGDETGALTERVSRLVTSRQQVVDSAEAERRRMERDLHDGAQQRLV